MVFPVHGRREPILGVVGPLQLEVVEARLKQEYNVDCKIESISYVALRWVKCDPKQLSDLENRSTGILRAVDRDERPVLLFESQLGPELHPAAEPRDRVRNVRLRGQTPFQPRPLPRRPMREVSAMRAGF